MFRLHFFTSRRRLPVLALALLLVSIAGCGPLYRWIGGNFAGPPGEMNEAISPGARALVAAAFEGIDPGRLADIHVHVAGRQGDGTGAEITPTAESWQHPIRRGQFRVYMSAAGITDTDRVGEQYLERLLTLIRNQPVQGRFFIYAMDRHYRPDGSVDPSRTPFFVPNRYVFDLAGKFPDLFVPVVSVHPYRPDALEELDRWAARGVRFVKWLPNSQGIDPSAERIEPFYRRMADHGMVLLTHTGRERAVHAGGDQHLGNPLRLRKPLDLGVTVVALHSASDGKDVDLDHPDRPKVSSFDLFLRLMDDPRYEERLFGEISATTFFNHLSRPLETLLARPDLQHRLLNGSDYPIPAVNLAILTSRLVRFGFITREEGRFLNEIYRYDPLIFDFVVKRTVRHPRTGEGFSPEVFMMPETLIPP